MSKQEALFQSLATSGAVLIIFIGLCHEAFGPTLFPWGPALFGGPIGWHGVGLAAIAMGGLLASGTLRIIKFPVSPWALVVAVIGLTVGLFTAITHHEFHMPAFAVFIAGIGTAIFHRKALQRATMAEA